MISNRVDTIKQKILSDLHELKNESISKYLTSLLQNAIETFVENNKSTFSL